MADEAPLVRLGLLIHCLAPTEWLAYSTSCVQNVCVNGYADVSKATRAWTPAPVSSTKTQIGVESGSSNLYWRTLGQYARLISGSATETDLFKDSLSKPVDTLLSLYLLIRAGGDNRGLALIYWRTPQQSGGITQCR